MTCFQAFYFRWLHANPCTYEINLGSNGNSQWIRNDQQWVNIFNGQYGQWALRKSGTAYMWVIGPSTNFDYSSPGVFCSIGPKNSNLVWTDMGPGSPANRQVRTVHVGGVSLYHHDLFQIQLRPFQSGNNRQQFRISNN